MVGQFFSNQYEGRGELFEGLSVWKNENYQNLQGTYPVISLSFANIKGTNFASVRESICCMIADLYDSHNYLLDSERLTENDKNQEGKMY